MTTINIADQLDPVTNVECSDCRWKGRAGMLDEIGDFQERVAPGEEVPAGACPECGALAHIVRDLPLLMIAVEGGIVQAVVSDRPQCFSDLLIALIDYDTEGAGRDEISRIDQGDGTKADACLRFKTVRPAEIDTESLRRIFRAMHGVPGEHGCVCCGTPGDYSRGSGYCSECQEIEG